MTRTGLTVFLVLVTIALTGQELYVMSYNIRYDNPMDGPDAWSERKAELVDMLKLIRPEILGLQEVTHPQLMFLDSALTDYTYVGVGRDDGKTAGEYSAIFYDSTKIKSTFTWTFWLAEDPRKISIGWDAAMERICTYGQFYHKVYDRKFWAFNTHFDHEGPQARLGSAELIKQVVDDVNTPVVLMGDFNALPNEGPIAILTGSLCDTYACTESEHVGPEGTWNGFEVSGAIDRRIDYIFTRGFEVRSHVHLGMRRKNNRHLSDHLPVVSQLAFE